ncbi:hypothetical protein [Novosphingobium sp. ST904]|uniref:hypothetical protein n=1 Tax=Novosphingobium sp. ST904 TaxID=1684385 RepID=UPI003511767A
MAAAEQVDGGAAAAQVGHGARKQGPAREGLAVGAQGLSGARTFLDMMPRLGGKMGGGAAFVIGKAAQVGRDLRQRGKRRVAHVTDHWRSRLW